MRNVPRSCPPPPSVTVTVAQGPLDGADDGGGSEAVGGLEQAPSTALEERFALGARLGRGGMGEVFFAEDGLLNRQVAVKVLGEGISPRRRRAVVGRFLREAQVTAQLSHPNVVPVYGLERTAEGQPALTMKLIRGKTFTDYMKECREAEGTEAYDPERHGVAARVEHLLSACDALAYAHSRGVIHRDLKPDNLMLGAFHEVYVMDWGIVRLIADSPETRHEESETAHPAASLAGPATMETQAGTVLGTPMYMPPEQAFGHGDMLGAAIDQYALGMVLFELLTFENPRAGGSMADLLLAASTGERKAFAATKPPEPVPPELQAIANKATSFLPEERYADVDSLAADLRRYLHGEEVRAYPDDRWRKLWRRLQRHPLRLLTGLLVIVLTAATITTGSLVQAVGAERQAALQGQHLAHLVATVASHVAGFDSLLFRVESLIEGLAVSATARLDGGKADGGLHYSPQDLGVPSRAPRDARHNDGYGQVVSLDHPVYVLPPGVTRAVVAAELDVLGPLGPVLRGAFLRSVSEASAALPEAEASALLAAGVPLQWGYVAFESGLMLNYPGNTDYPSDYDPRKRPWYLSARDTRGASWGDLYADASGTGFLLPCNKALYDSAGAFMGVAGFDLGMDDIIDQMEVPGLDGVSEAYLVDSSGRVLVSSRERGTRSALSTAGNKTKTTERIDAPALVGHADAGTASGFVVQGDELYVFARLQALPWLLVVRLEADQHLRR